MITIPDFIDLIILKYRRFMDYPYRFLEAFGSWMNVYAWNKRWKNRTKGTGYARKS